MIFTIDLSKQLTNKQMSSHEDRADQGSSTLALSEPVEQLSEEHTEGEEYSVGSDVADEPGEADDPAPASVGGSRL